MSEILAELTKYPVATRLSLNGTIIVGRDIAHARIKERLDKGEPMPQYLKDHPIYYAGPAKTPEGMPSGSFGPTTAGRMDSYVDQFQSAGGSMVMIAKGNRSRAGDRRMPQARRLLPRFNRWSRCHPRTEQHQESRASRISRTRHGKAIWKIEVEDFPAFILVDDKGNDFFTEISNRCSGCPIADDKH